MNVNRSLYIHIPFCRRKCDYCDFYSIAHDAKLAGSYIDVLIDQVSSLEGGLSTVYIGGGTPTVISGRDIGRLLLAISRKLSGGSRTEFTVEANPESLDEDKVGVLLKGGVNRISIGVQSLRDEKLRRLGRIHDARRARESVIAASRLGFGNMTIDLMFGVPGETIKDWLAEIDLAARLPITHISCYSLTYEKGTPLFRALKDEEFLPPDEALSGAMYRRAIGALSKNGFSQYEISSFARGARFRSRHNMNYWNGGDYAGLGAGAVSYAGGVRASNIPDVAEYVRRYKAGESLVSSSEKLSAKRSAREKAAVRIRTIDGIDSKWFHKTTGYDLFSLEGDAIKGLIESGLVVYKKKRGSITGIRLTGKGIPLCDTVSAGLL